ncbi:MAG: ankyrin repeat domain-containing protein [Acidobacteriota bacterium]
MAGDSFVSRLYRAMKDGEDATVRRLVKKHRHELDAPDDGCIAPPLIACVTCERADYLALLLEAGAEPNHRSLGTKGASHNLRALEMATWYQREDLQRLLLGAGATEDFGTWVFRADVERVRDALTERPELADEVYIRPGHGLLHVAAQVGSGPLAVFLLEQGFDPNAADVDGHAPLRYAARNEPALEVLAALHAAGADLDQGNKAGITALTAACRHRESLPTIEWLLRAGADPDLVPKNGVSALMKAVNSRVPEMVSLLLEHGADRAHRDKKGATALDLARRKKLDAIVGLLESG